MTPVDPHRRAPDVGPSSHGAAPGAREALEVDKLADLAQGGMGTVEVGVVRSGRLAGRVVAIKRLHPDLAKDPAIVSMFVDEAWLTAQIRSPHVVKVEAFGEDARGIFLACELVQGVSLQRLMAEARARGEAFTERTVAFIASQVCAGLAAAHDLRDAEGRPLGLVHRDLTPGNLLVGFDGVVKIADFGIAKAERRVSAATQMGVLKGKPSYVSPEQVRGGPIDGRADLFALGIVLFELLAGRRPWRGKDDTDVLIAMMRTEPPRLTELRPDVSPTMAHLVEGCLRKQSAERPQSADEVRATLDALRAERGFVADDRAWLVDFVGRNGAELASWFQQALGGHLMAGGRSLEQAEQQIDLTRVRAASPTADPVAEAAHGAESRPLDALGGEAATTFYQHAAPLPGAAAMAAALAAPPSGLPSPPSPPPRGSEELARQPATTPPRSPAQTEILPSSAAFARSSGVPSSAPRSPAVTEWMPAPTSSNRAPVAGEPLAAPPPPSFGTGTMLAPLDAGAAAPPSFGTGTVIAQVDLGPAAPASMGQPRIPPAPPTVRDRSDGIVGKVLLVFAVVFVLTAATVGALLHFGVLHAP